MIIEYLDAAMKRAHYEMIEDLEPYYGEIRECQGVWASGKSLEECRESLQQALEGWIILRLQRGLEIPELDGIRLTHDETSDLRA